MASHVPQFFEDVVNSTKKAFSKDELLRSPQDDDDRLRALSQQVGLSDDIADLRGSRTTEDGQSNDDVVRQNSQRTRLQRANSSPGERAARNKAARDAAVKIAAEARMDSADEVATSVPVRRFHQMSTKQQIWAIMDDPTSSRAAQIVAAVIMTMILVSCVAFVVQTLPQYVMDESSGWAIIEDLCIAVFTLEFTLRVYSTPNRWAFFTSIMNLIDLLAILPFYVELMIGTDSSGSQIIRLVRLIRIFRIFKISRYLPWVRVFTNALALSLQPLIMLVLVVMIAMVLFSSVIYYAERGEWSEADQAWMRATPDGPVVSPYQSIPACFWWCIVTMTTVGYGDMFPVTGLGRLIAACASLSGILVVAIPVSVISTNFNGEYAKLLRQREQVKARMLLLKRQFRENKTGLEAVLDEVEDIVVRNTQELEGEINTLFDQARVELTEELCEILKMAYERRRQLHLAALAAGRLQTSVVAQGLDRRPGEGPGSEYTPTPGSGGAGGAAALAAATLARAEAAGVEIPGLPTPGWEINKQTSARWSESAGAGMGMGVGRKGSMGLGAGAGAGGSASRLHSTTPSPALGPAQAPAGVPPLPSLAPVASVKPATSPVSAPRPPTPPPQAAAVPAPSLAPAAAPLRGVEQARPQAPIAAPSAAAPADENVAHSSEAVQAVAPMDDVTTDSFTVGWEDGEGEDTQEVTPGPGVGAGGGSASGPVAEAEQAAHEGAGQAGADANPFDDFSGAAFGESTSSSAASAQQQPEGQQDGGASSGSLGGAKDPFAW